MGQCTCIHIIIHLIIKEDGKLFACTCPLWVFRTVHITMLLVLHSRYTVFPLGLNSNRVVNITIIEYYYEILAMKRE